MGKKTIVAIAILSISVLSSCAKDRPVPESKPTGNVREEYEILLKELATYNSNGMDYWTMNIEHLFVGYGDLRERVIRFVRRPGALDLLFGRLLDERITEPEVLAIAELLVYFGSLDEKGDEDIWSNKADAVLVAMDKKPLLTAQENSGAPIRPFLGFAVHKSQHNAKTPTTHPNNVGNGN